jgi:hypothetical protein
VFYDLVDLGKVELIENDSQFGVWNHGRFFRLGDPGPDWE